MWVGRTAGGGISATYVESSDLREGTREGWREGVCVGVGEKRRVAVSASRKGGWKEDLPLDSLQIDLPLHSPLSLH